jgi:hypothetical protein
MGLLHGAGGLVQVEDCKAILLCQCPPHNWLLLNLGHTGRLQVRFVISEDFSALVDLGELFIKDALEDVFSGLHDRVLLPVLSFYDSVDFALEQAVIDVVSPPFWRSFLLKSLFKFHHPERHKLSAIPTLNNIRFEQDSTFFVDDVLVGNILDKQE